MYTGYLLTDKSRALLLSKFPPKYPDVIAHHITEKFGVSRTEPSPEMPQRVTVVGYADDGEAVEGLLVMVNGSTSRPSGGLYHITLSIDKSKGARPVHTNDVIKNAKKVPEIDIEVIPKNFHY